MHAHKEQILKLHKQLLLQDIPGPVTCECCGKVIATHADAINLIPLLQVGVPGHPAVESFQCPHHEHWACSPDCWVKVAHRCIDEDFKGILEEIFTRIEHKETFKNKG